MVNSDLGLVIIFSSIGLFFLILTLILKKKMDAGYGVSTGADVKGWGIIGWRAGARRTIPPHRATEKQKNRLSDGFLFSLIFTLVLLAFDGMLIFSYINIYFFGSR